MRTKNGEKFKLESVEELLGIQNEESAMDIEINKICPFRKHPFKVIDDEKMQELVESITTNGVLTPVLVRPLGMDTYEMISGHRRMHVLHCMSGNTTKVKNIKKYLLAALFNAPSTMNGYYQAEVNHDMPGLVR